MKKAEPNPTKIFPSQHKNLAPLASFESDNVRLLLQTVSMTDEAVKETPQYKAHMRAESHLTDYCNHLIKRKGLDPAKTAIEPNLQFVMELPAAAIASAVAQHQANQPQIVPDAPKVAQETAGAPLREGEEREEA